MMDFDVEEKLRSLTLQEKVAILAGSDAWHTTAVPSKSIPAICTSDGPNGVRGTRFFAGVPAACLPCGTALGATFDRDLLHQAGELIGKECLAKSAHCWLGPTINIQRSPLGGRGFESYSEDPLLSGLLAASICKECMSQDVIPTPKHFVCNDQETERNCVDTLITERALREIYLKPFQIIARENKTGALMTAYNKLNGKHCSEEARLLDDIVRKEWDWDPLIMSDWFGTYSTVDAANAGLDLEMPGPTIHRGQLLERAVNNRQVTHATIDDRARRMLTFVKEALKAPVAEEEGGRNLPEDQALNRKIAAESIVLLENKGAVPLPADKKYKLALIGSHMKKPAISGGGSASLDPYYVVTPYDALRERADKIGCEVRYELGAVATRAPPLLGDELRTSDGKPGATMRFYNEPPETKDRECIGEEHLKETYFMLADYTKLKRLRRSLFYATVEATLKVEETIEWDFSLAVWGTGQLYVDGDLVVDNTKDQKAGDSFFGAGTVDVIGSKRLEKGRTYQVRFEFGSAATSEIKGAGPTDMGGGGGRLGGTPRYDRQNLVNRAEEAARWADYVVVCTGLNSDWESEGYDREHMKLPPGVDDMIATVCRANQQTVSVTQSGTPFEMPWRDLPSSIVHAWYGGNETGHGMADVLFGDVNPCGKLPLSWPKKLEDNPSYLNVGATNGRVLYGEDVFVGYRYYDSLGPGIYDQGKEVLFPFGHGLSYSPFIINLRSVDKTATSVTVRVDNKGRMAGSQVVQLYMSHHEKLPRRPRQELVGFGKVFVEAGEQREVKIDIDPYAMSYWDEVNDQWCVAAGMYRVAVGRSSRDIAGSQVIEINEARTWKGLKGPKETRWGDA